MIQIQITGDREVAAKMGAMPDRVHTALLRKMKILGQNLRNYIVRDKLNGQVLNVKSGALARSIQEQLTDEGDTITEEVFSAGNLIYAPVHEYGGKSSYEIYPVKAKTLAFMAGGKMIFAKKVNHPPAKERSYMRSSLADMKQQIIDGMSQAAAEGVA